MEIRPLLPAPRVTYEGYEIVGFSPATGFEVRAWERAHDMYPVRAPQAPPWGGGIHDMRDRRYDFATAVWWRVRHEAKDEAVRGSINERIEYEIGAPGWSDKVILPAAEERVLVFNWASLDAHTTFSTSNPGTPILHASRNQPERVTSPAGAFGNCIRMVATYFAKDPGQLRFRATETEKLTRLFSGDLTSSDRREWGVGWQTRSYYCPGVGLVLEEQADANGDPLYKMELVRYHVRPRQ